MTANTWTIASGATLYAGCAAPSIGPEDWPQWRKDLQEGQYADISLNTFQSVLPAGWPLGEEAGPFINWSGAIRASDYGPLGAYSLFGSGHLSYGSPLCAGVGNFNVFTRMWERSNDPTQPLLEINPNIIETDGSFVGYNLNYESDVPATLNHLYPGHMYNGLNYIDAAHGGGPKGTMLQTFIGGSSARNILHAFDLSLAHGPSTRFSETAIVLGGNDGGTYPMSASDNVRGCTYMLSGEGKGPVKSIDWATKVITTHHASAQFNVSGQHNMIYLPAPWDCLVTMGYDYQYSDAFPTRHLDVHVRVFPIINNVVQPPVEVFPTGTQPTHAACGGTWVEKLNRLACFPGGTGQIVFTLTPPAPGSLTTGTWAWNSIAMTGNSGQAVSNPGINGNNGFPYNNNGSWGKFIYFPNLECCLWCNGVLAPVQAFVLPGMNTP